MPQNKAQERTGTKTHTGAMVHAMRGNVAQPQRIAHATPRQWVKAWRHFHKDPQAPVQGKTIRALIRFLQQTC